MTLKHIDNSFYALTGQQARKLAVGNRMPSFGSERRANLAALEGIQIESRRGVTTLKQSMLDCAWIQRTRLSWFDGRPVKNGWKWALRVHFADSVTQHWPIVDA